MSTLIMCFRRLHSLFSEDRWIPTKNDTYYAMDNFDRTSLLVHSILIDKKI